MNKNKIFKIILISFLILTSMYFLVYNNLLFSKSHNSYDEESKATNTDMEDIEYKLYKDKLVFALLGVDAEGDLKLDGKRTDTMMLVTVDFLSKDINLISIPRDTRVLKENGYYDKINHSHAYGGISSAMKSLRDLTGVNVSYYVRMDYKAVEKVIDTIGGVEVNVPFHMKYDDTTPGDEVHIDIKKGKQVLDGRKSIEYLRWRKNNDGEGYPLGDMGRIEKHQEFIKLLIKQSLKPSNFTKIPEFTKIYNDYISTNIPLKTMIGGVWSFKDLNINNINSYTIPGEYEYINDISYYTIDEEEVQDYISDIFKEFNKNK